MDEITIVEKNLLFLTAPSVTGAISGLGAGIVASLIAPWVHWKIEEVREKIKARRELIKSFRHIIRIN